MPFEIVRNDITQMQVDAIVNTANPKPVIGSGVDAGIHRAAGPELLAAREKIGRIGVGEAAITPGFDLNAKYVIHTVGPVWRGGLLGEARLLRSCYESALALAWENGCESIAFPLISTGNYGFPKDKALQIALNAIRGFLNDHEMMVSLVVFDREAFQLSRQRYREVASFIDDNYIQEKTARQISPYHNRREVIRREWDALDDFCLPMECAEAAPSLADRNSIPLPYAKSKPSLTDLLAETDAGFSETLLKLIDQTGKKDSEIYTKANLSRQHFSKIRNNPHYQPTKPTAIALALALELDLEQTRDLIGRAGYALTTSSKFDVIIMYFIRERNFNLFDINAALFEFDQSLLGG